MTPQLPLLPEPVTSVAPRDRLTGSRFGGNAIAGGWEDPLRAVAKRLGSFAEIIVEKVRQDVIPIHQPDAGRGPHPRVRIAGPDRYSLGKSKRVAGATDGRARTRYKQ